MTNWQTFCLSYLEIDRWVMRTDRTKKLGVYLNSDHLNSDSQALLEAILQYAGISFSQVQILRQGDPLHLHAQLCTFGEIPRGYEGEILLKAPGLEQMLKEPLKKKALLDCKLGITRDKVL